MGFWLFLCFFSITNSESKSFEKDMFIVLPEKSTYYQALTTCRSLKLDLIKIQNEEMNEYISSMAIANGLSDFWIDINYLVGKNIINENIQKEKNTRITEKCAHNDGSKGWINGTWNNINCLTSFSVICHGETVFENDGMGELVILPDPMDYQHAAEYCHLFGMTLVKIKNDISDRIFREVAEKHLLGSYWINANNRKFPGRWSYFDDVEIIYSNWDSTEPQNLDGNENCVHGNHKKFWNDGNCNTNHTVFCIREKYLDYSEITPDVETMLHEDHFLILPDKVQFQQAQTDCRGLGLNLVKITDEPTNSYVSELVFARGLGTFWVDASDSNKEGHWIDSNGEPINYSNWNLKQPNNKKNTEHCATVQNNGIWDDNHCLNRYVVVCYGQRSIANIGEDELLFVSTKMNFEKATSMCRSKGMSLIKILNKNTDRMVHKVIQKYPINYFWIDATNNKFAGRWTYSDNTVLKYSNWHPEAFDPKDPRNKCAHGNFDKMWNDEDCSAELNVICLRKRSSKHTGRRKATIIDHDKIRKTELIYLHKNNS